MKLRIACLIVILKYCFHVPGQQHSHVPYLSNLIIKFLQNKRIRYSEFSYCMDVRDIVILRERAHELEMKNAAMEESSAPGELHEQPVALLH